MELEAQGVETIPAGLPVVNRGIGAVCASPVDETKKKQVAEFFDNCFTFATPVIMTHGERPRTREGKEMMDYLVEKIAPSGEKIETRSVADNSGKRVNLIKVGNDGLVWLVDKHFGEDNFAGHYNQFSRENQRFAVVFYKDGENFFRHYKSDCFKRSGRYSHSLVDYSGREKHQTLLLSKEEKYCRGRIQKTSEGYTERKRLQYYQPKSERLDRGIVTCGFENIVLNHLTSVYGVSDSKSVFKCSDRKDEDCDLGLCGTLLKPSN